jgi:hypothetical protein
VVRGAVQAVWTAFRTAALKMVVKKSARGPRVPCPEDREATVNALPHVRSARGAARLVFVLERLVASLPVGGWPLDRGLAVLLARQHAAAGGLDAVAQQLGEDDDRGELPVAPEGDAGGVGERHQ